LGNYQTYSDEQLLALLNKSDIKAFESIYYRYWKRIFMLAESKLADLHLVEEIVQDLFASLWERRERIDVNITLVAYLSAAIKYKIIDASVKRKKNSVTELKNIELNYQTDPFADAREVNEIISNLLSALPEKSRLVFQMSKQEGYSHREIARHFNISEKTVEYHLGQATKLLRTGVSHLYHLLIIL
jgi:RNA polymerase sigma-70 factor (family 1)